MKSIGFILVIGLVSISGLSGQCPDKQFLWHRITYLRDSTKIPAAEQLNELLKYLGQMKNCPYQGDSTHTLLLQRIGWLYSLQKDFVNAIHYSRQSLGIVYKNLGKPTVNYSDVIKTYNNLRILYDSSGQYRLRQQALDSCITIGLRLGTGYIYALKALPIRTYDYLEAGDYYKCIEFSNLGVALSKTETAYSYYLPYYLIWKTNSLILLNRFQEAEEVLTNAINDFIKSKDTVFLGTFYGLMARISEEKRNERNTLAYLNKSMYYNILANSRRVSAEVLSNVGYNLYFRGFKKYDIALQYYYKALQYADAGESVNIYENIANLYVTRGVYDLAFSSFQKAFDQLKYGIDEDELLQHTERYVTASMTEYIATLLVDKADARLAFYKANKQLKNLNLAIASYKTIDKIFDKIRFSQTDIQSKLFWRNNIRRLYEHAVEACYLQNNVADAFYFFEKSRSVLLNDQLVQQHSFADEDILRQAQLKKQIAAKETELSRANKSMNDRAELQKEIFSDRQELDRLQDQIKDKNPLYYQSFLDTSVINAVTVKSRLLNDHQAIVEILTGDSAVYVLAITNQNSILNKLNKNDFDSLSNRYTSYLSDAVLLNKNFEDFKNVSSRLYQLIFQNISLPVGRIIISIDSKYIPFEALITKKERLTYFVDDHAVSYTYSARYLMNDFAFASSAHAHGFMGMAPVQFAPSMQLRSLAGSDQSLRRMQQYFSYTSNFTGKNASKNNFLADYYKYRIIQLYTHATDSGYAGQPTIYFNDSTLLLNDLIYQNRPATSLIVLSACETASGKLYNGEGVFSFNRQFAALGIPSSVANLWQADNQSSYRLTELFYKYVSRGHPLDVALQEAKKEFRRTTGNKETELPYYWAASVLVGQTNPIQFQSSSWVWIGLIVVLLVLAYWVERKWVVK